MVDVDFCVVGAGFAGLTAALRLKQAGRSVALLEARDRIGGRTFTETRADGTWIDRGGAWVGPGQDRIYALMSEFGVPSYKQYADGEAMMVVDGKQYRYRGTVPLTLNPIATVNLGTAMLELATMCKTIPLDAPWDAKKRGQVGQHDRRDVAGSPRALAWPRAALLETAIGGTYTSDTSEISLLFALHQMASGGGPQFVFGVEGGSQDSRIVGGMGAVYGPMAAEIGDSLHLSAAGAPDRAGRRRRDRPLRRHDGAARQRDRRRTDRHRQPNPLRANASRGPVVSASAHAQRRDIQDQHRLRRTVLARGRPVRTVGGARDARAGDHRRVHRQRLPRGAVRDHRGADRADADRARSGQRRRELVLDELGRRFGSKARAPVDFVEQNWTTERYSGGGMISHAPPECSPNSDPRCVSPAAESTGRAPRVRPSCAAGWTAPFARVNARRPRCWRRSGSRWDNG